MVRFDRIRGSLLFQFIGGCMVKPKAPAQAGRRRAARANRRWCDAFLNSLSETSNVSASAVVAKIDVSKAYRLRRADPEFARNWQSALYDGYCHLEFEVVRRLRDGDYATKDGNKFDFANAVRILAAHRDSAAKERAERANVSAADVRAAIDRKVDDIRARIVSGQYRGDA